MVPFVVNGEEDRWYTHRVPATDHGEAIEAVRRRNMGDAGGGRRTRGRGDTVVNDLHRVTSGNRGAVGWRYVPYLRCVQGRQGTKEESTGGRRGGAKRRERNKFGPPWQTCGKLRGGGSVGRWSYSKNRNWKGEEGRGG